MGTREPAIYGTETLADIHRRLAERASELHVTVEAFQSNHEGALLDRIGAARGAFEGLLLNGGALTHTSLALFDAIKAVGLPCVEVHLSNPEAAGSYFWNKIDFKGKNLILYSEKELNGTVFLEFK